MSNAIATQFSTKAILANDALGAAVQQASEQAASTSTATLYLRVHQDGSPQAGALTYGADHTEVDPSSQWVLDVQGIEHGYILRNKATVVSSEFVPLHVSLPNGHPDARLAYRGVFRCISAHHRGTQVEFGGDSEYIRRFFTGTLFPAIQQRLAKNPGEARIYPIVTLNTDSYHNKGYNKTIYTIGAAIVDWMDREGSVEGDAVEPVAEPVAEPAPRRARRVLSDDDIPA